MKNVLLVLALFAAFALQADESETADFDRFYVGGAGVLVLPPGGSDMGRLGGAALRAGCYVTEALALEGEAGWLENRCGLSARALFHLHGLGWFDALFGYSRFDPFVMGGAKGWLNDGTVGPAAGAGALYHLTDSWALRADADATLGLDGETEVVFSLSAGLQYSF